MYGEREFMDMAIPDKVRIVKQEKEPMYIKYILNKYLPKLNKNGLYIRINPIRDHLLIKSDPPSIYEIAGLVNNRSIKNYRILYDEVCLSLRDTIEKLK